MDGLVGVIVLLNNLVDRLVSISRYLEGRGYNLLSAMIKGYASEQNIAKKLILSVCNLPPL